MLEITDYAKRRSRFFYFVVASYIILLVVLCVTRFSLISYVFGNHVTREYSYNLVPFKSIIDNWNRIGKLSWDAFGNMLMFIPLGVVYSLFSNKKRVIAPCLYCLATSVVMELFQFIFSTGAVDVDDVILNTTGGLFGVFLYSMINLFCKRRFALTKKIVEIATTIFPPFLLFYIADMTFGRGKYYFFWWHTIPIVVYFMIMYFIFLKDLSTKQLIIYYLFVFTFAIYFFCMFM